MKSIACLVSFVTGVYVGLCTPLLASKICVTVDDETALLLAGAVVRIVSLSDAELVYFIVTDRKGSACSDDLPSGLYYVDANLAGFRNVRYYPVRAHGTEDINLSFRLPFVDEELLPLEVPAAPRESKMVGKLLAKDRSPASISICFFQQQDDSPVACTDTNSAGEYALVVPPGVYRVEMTEASGRKQIGTSTVDLSEGSTYTDLLSLPSEE